MSPLPRNQYNALPLGILPLAELVGLLKRREWAFTAAQVDLKLVDVAATERMFVTQALVTVDSDAALPTQFRLGLGAAGLNVPVVNNAAGADGNLASHSDCPAGSGEVVGIGWPGLVAIGNLGDDLYLSCDATSVGNQLRVLVSWFLGS